MPRQFPELAEADWAVDRPLVGREVRCQNDKAWIFDCHDVDLLAYLPERALGGRNLTGVWGWTDAASGREFVIAGHEEGTVFVEITDPLNPRYLGTLPRHAGTQPSEWRDVKVYRHYALIVSDAAGPHGMQVFDLDQLLSLATAPAEFRETAHYDRIANAHTLAVDTLTGFAYVVGANGAGETCDGGLHVVDIHAPTNPTFVTCYPETLGGRRQRGYIHETDCVVYHGPDRRYRGRELCLDAAEQGLGLVDVTDKRQPKLISVATYPRMGYTHQGWLTEDQRYFFLDDEFDEHGDSARPRTIVFDLRDLTDPVVAAEFLGTTTSRYHNLYIRGRYVYQSNYRAGLRVLDAQDPTHPREVGYFDTTPLEPNTTGMSGTWNNYPYFARRGVVAVTTMAPANPGETRNTTKGLFILRCRGAAEGR